jgi:hypothetical protein
MEVITMVGPLVYDLARQHVAELLAEREMDRLAAELPPTPKRRVLKLEFGRFLPTPRNRQSGAAMS